jgi:hypothetical protein
MSFDELERILAAEKGDRPLIGLVSSVMDAVCSQAAAAPPIPFPWRRFLPGAVAMVVALVLVFRAAWLSLEAPLMLPYSRRGPGSSRLSSYPG